MEKENLKKSFEPIISSNARILILGSLPSDKSIIKNEYYGNRTNHFWNILSLVFENKKIEFKDYNEKIQCLNRHGVALWDVYSSAKRKGSLDTNIKDGEFNDIKKLINNYQTIKKVILNGKEAEKSFQKYLKRENIHCDYQYVPSSSSANTKYTVEEKAKLWKEAILK